TLQPIQYSSNEVARVGESPRERRSGEGRTHIRFHAPLVAQRRAPPGFRRRSYGSTRLHTCTSSRRPESSPRDALRGVRGRSVPSATPRTLAVRLASSRPAWEEVGPWGVAGRERSALNFTGASMGTTPQSARPFQGAPRRSEQPLTLRGGQDPQHLPILRHGAARDLDALLLHQGLHDGLIAQG